MFGLSFAILMKAPLKLCHLVRTLIIGNMSVDVSYVHAKIININEL
jgi:hypothetical protein